MRDERVPLTGADCFLRAFDSETLRWNGASHLSQLVLRLGPGFDLDRFRRVLVDVVGANPILRAPIRRDWGLAPPSYRLDRAERAAAPRVEIHEADAPELPALFARRLNETRSARRGELLRVDVVRRDEGRVGTDLAFTWLHMLFDGHGSERFVAFLEACGAGTCGPADVPKADAPRSSTGNPAAGEPARARRDGDGVATPDGGTRRSGRALPRRTAAPRASRPLLRPLLVLGRGDRAHRRARERPRRLSHADALLPRGGDPRRTTW